MATEDLRRPAEERQSLCPADTREARHCPDVMSLPVSPVGSDFTLLKGLGLKRRPRANPAIE